MTIEEFKRKVAKGHIYRSVYHFTDVSNLPSIAEHGLVSKARAAALGVEISAHGGNQWSHNADALKGLEDYVNLCFTQSHPMCYVAQQEGRIARPTYLPIDPAVVEIPGARITTGVANQAGVELLTVEQGLCVIDWEVLYTHTDWNDDEIQIRLQAAEKYEILIPERVPLDFIRRRF